MFENQLVTNLLAAIPSVSWKASVFGPTGWDCLFLPVSGSFTLLNRMRPAIRVTLIIGSYDCHV